MPMHYGHPEDGDKPCRCPRCGWSGTLHQTDEFTPASGGESFQVCPKCAPEVPVIPDQDKTYFGLTIHQGRYVLESEINELPFAAFWRESAVGSTTRCQDGEMLVYLRDWEAFSLLFIRTGKHRFQKL